MIATSYPELLANLKAMIDAAPIDCGHKLPEWRALAGGETIAPELCDIKTRALMVAVHGPMRPHSLRVDVRYQIDGARGCYTVSHHRAALQRLADKVAKIPGAFGYKRPRAVAPRAANVTRWSTAALSVWRQSLECQQFEDAARLGLEKLGARFMVNKDRPFLFVAPAPIEGQPARIVTARRCDGKWLALDWLSLLQLSPRTHGSRAAAAEDAQNRVEEMGGARKLAEALGRCNPEPQAAARDAWLTARGLDNADVPAAGPDVPDWLSGFQGSIVATPESVATETAPVVAAEPEPAPVLDQTAPSVAAALADPAADPDEVARLVEVARRRPELVPTMRERVRSLADRLPHRAAEYCAALAVLDAAPKPPVPVAAGSPAAAPAAHPRLAEALAIIAAAVTPAPALPADAPEPASPGTDALAPEPPAPSPRRILAAFLPGLAMRSPGTGSRLAGRALPAAHQSGPAGLVLARLRPGGADALPTAVVASEITAGKPDRRALQPRPHRHTAWLRHPAGEWRRFAPGVAGAAALAGVHGASLRRSILALAAAEPAAHRAGAAAGLAARLRGFGGLAGPLSVVASVHRAGATGPPSARLRPWPDAAGPPSVVAFANHLVGQVTPQRIKREINHD